MQIFHYCLKKNLKHPTTRKASSVTPIWKPLGQGSSLAPLRTTFDAWLPPDPVPTEKLIMQATVY